MSEPARAADTCYRHPDRRSYVLCQRCGRTICPECQTQAAVGVHCPECVREARQSAPRRQPAVLQAVRRQSTPVVTYALIGLSALIWILQLLPGSPVTAMLLYYPPFTVVEPWRMVTAIFVHSSSAIFHILFNMFALYMFGRVLEGLLGRVRFLALYLISGFGGSVAVLWLAPQSAVVGASGAVFGLFAAFFVIQRRLGVANPTLLILIAINLGIGFIIPGISWQAHLGGVITGAAIALVYLRTRRADQRWLQVGLVAAVVGVLVVLIAARIAIG